MSQEAMARRKLEWQANVGLSENTYLFSSFLILNFYLFFVAFTLCILIPFIFCPFISALCSSNLPHKIK